MKNHLISIGLLFLAVGVVVFNQSAVSAGDASLSRIVFFVACYDVGKSALEGLNGVKDVRKGFKGSKEINTVTYDPKLISPERMIEALKAADTYLGTADP